MRRVIKLLDTIDIKYFMLIAWVVITFLYGVRAVVGDSLAGSSGEYLKIQEQVDRLRIENMVLENKIAQKSSLKYTSQVATELGFKPAKVVILK